MKTTFFIFLPIICIAIFICDSVSKAEGVNEISNNPTLNDSLKYTSKTVELNVSVRGSYRMDRLDWNIAGYLGDDYWNVLSELIWKDLKIYQIQLDTRMLIKNRIFFRGTLNRGWIYSGENEDTDYNGNDRTNAFSQSQNDSDDGSVSDFSIGVGYFFKPFGHKFRLAPMIGFSQHDQDLTITDGYQTISEAIEDKSISAVPTGSFSGLNSSYQANWMGPWVGGEFVYDWSKYSQLTVSIEYHWADYYAKANWNLIERFDHPKSFEHDASGNGIVLGADFRSRFYQNWCYNLNIGYQMWQTESGIDRTFFSDGDEAETRLNEVNWRSFALAIGVGYQF